MGGIRLPDGDFIKQALNEADGRLLSLTGYCYLLEFRMVEEAGGVVRATRDDGAKARLNIVLPKTKETFELDAFERRLCAQQYFNQRLGDIVEILAANVAKDEVEPEAPPAEPELRFETVIVFTARPDIVLTPPGGVPADEATRVYRHFRDGAAAIGGRCFTAPVEAA